ncbi:TetR family transcriptional regulator [Alicyclobacillus cycloheptanicus]|uniref:AcrR family transcriptional regulator n=1 Tax=Alicyclobacillus cycloheptanicus TaxID=1457 RepID=A0ABT9XJ19_9BACL|nr:TetR family transcriptional regulator [Alicyclobacillus cycloheptanicus]MDQ0189783.1 AcrR family transcriptional regulator [Alicyclobacillus cycloheptanicus]WDM01986.1 TetR family transcriptional regulator [Alicyclobacillus cycloheptanicus]
MRNAEETKERILAAALEEFSSYGIAGARVDRIAKNAGCNKNLIYVYFENKDTLFTTVLKKHLTRVYEEIPFTPEDLPGYAAKVFDWAMTHPHIVRLMSWYSLEQKTENITERTSVRDKKIKAIMKAQNDGLIGTTFTPDFLLTAIMALATAWTPTHPFGPSHDPDAVKTPKKTRDAIAKAIRLIAKGEES